jgi:hypothetical protein
MSLDKAFRDMVRAEVEAQMRPLQQALGQLQSSLGDMQQMQSALEPVLRFMSGFSGAPLPQPARRGPGRPRKVAAEVAAPSGGKRRGRRPSQTSGQPCAVIGCGRPSRTKGYCAAHYQKLRLLERTHRRPASWEDNAAPNSVEDVKLPRGRAGSKALQEGRSREA